MKYIIFMAIICGMLFFCAFSGSSIAAETSIVPLPPELKGLPSINAEPWVQVDENPVLLEGPAFDRQGNLYCSAIDGRILKITPDKNITSILQQSGLMPLGIAIHKDGRLFVVTARGKIFTVKPDGTDQEFVLPRYQQKPRAPNDLGFDLEGNL